MIRHGNSIFWGICLLVTVLPMLNSCKTIASFVHDGKVVAKLGEHRLYKEDLDAYIPKSASPDDSTRLALQYINSWTSDMAFLDIAEKELSKTEKDVSAELEDYRHSLLKYRYEQKYINQHLDTSITAAQIEKYYESHLETFKLQLPIAKARFLSISADSPNLEIIVKKLSSGKTEDYVEVEELAHSSAMRYTDFGGKWVDLVKLSREFGIDYGTVLSQMNGGIVRIPDDNGLVNIAHIGELMRAGETGPVEYYSERIKDIILSSRKQALLSGLERDLLENARAQENLTIY